MSSRLHLLETDNDYGDDDDYDDNDDDGMTGCFEGR